MTLEQKKADLSDIEARQNKLLSKIKKIGLLPTAINPTVSSGRAFKLLVLALQVTMLEAQKYVIISAPMPIYPEGSRPIGGFLATVGQGEERIIFAGKARQISPEDIKSMTDKFEMDLLIEKNRYGGLSPTREHDMRAIFDAQLNAQAQRANKKTRI